jgi:aldose 1-epimerase
MAVEKVELKHAPSGASAQILPGFGFNCYSWRPVVAGGAFEALWAVPDFDQGTGRPSHSGIPLLFPFPGRIRDSVYEYGGKRYTLTASSMNNGNAIHGFVMSRPWEVIERDVARVKARFLASKMEPKILEEWPADFEVTAEYALSAEALSFTFTVRNPDTKPLPWALGLHPYFRAPLGEQGTIAECSLDVPAASRWELVNVLPTGKQLEVAGAYDLRLGHRIGETAYDDVYGGLPSGMKRHVCLLDDPANKRQIRVAFGDEYNTVVVYTPPHREAVCIEPYTCVPDVFWLTDRVHDVGLQVLAPGESYTTRVEFMAAPL